MAENPKLEQLKAVFREMGTTANIIVAFSGGVDSALLAWVANDVLGDKSLAVTAVSPSLATLEHDNCKELAKEWGLNWEQVETSEIDREEYQKNDTNRCYWCKDSLMEALGNLGAEHILLGVNLDDLTDHRPGIDAARDKGARFPYLEADISKQDVRDISKELNLRTWDKPAEPCLASRVPFGIRVSEDILKQVDLAERKLKGLGFLELRVRHHNDTARIEVPESDFESIMENKLAILEAVKEAGYKFVALDLEGLRTGSLLPKDLLLKEFQPKESLPNS